MGICQSFTDLIGNTPLLELSNTAKAYQLSSRIIAKLEYFNPTGSIKDRLAKALLEDAELVLTDGALGMAGAISKAEAIAAKAILVIFPDAGERYLSTPMFQNP